MLNDSAGLSTDQVLKPGDPIDSNGAVFEGCKRYDLNTTSELEDASDSGADSFSLGLMSEGIAPKSSNDENRVTLKEGNWQRWIDRIEFPRFEQRPTFAMDLYSTLEESTDNDGVYDFLKREKYVKGTETNSDIGKQGNRYVRFPNGSSALEIVAFKYKTNEELEELESIASNSISAVFAAFDRDHPEVFWLDTSFITVQASQRFSIGGKYDHTEMTIYLLLCGYHLYGEEPDPSGIWNTSFRTDDDVNYAISIRDNRANELAAAIKDMSDAQKIRFFNTWLACSNDYNSTDLDSLPSRCPLAFESLTSLVGRSGAAGPVCESYARALAVLCAHKDVNIPCVLVSGYKDGESHMWNYIGLEKQEEEPGPFESDLDMDGIDGVAGEGASGEGEGSEADGSESGGSEDSGGEGEEGGSETEDPSDPAKGDCDDYSWYAVDVTLNGSKASGLARLSSEIEDYLLVGSASKLYGETFANTHIIENSVISSVIPFTNGPVLAKNAYDLSETVSMLDKYNTTDFAEYDISEFDHDITQGEVGPVSGSVYTSFAVCPEPDSVTLRGDKLTLGEDYKLIYSSNVNVGTASVTVCGIGYYAGQVKRTFKITPAKIKLKSVQAPTAVWTGKQVTPKVSIDCAIATCTDGVGYTPSVAFANNVNVGKGQVTVTVNGKGNFTGSDTMTVAFNIVPKKLSLSKLAPGKRTITAKWTKAVSGCADGYQIQYSTSKSFNKGVKTKKVSKRATTKLVMKGLKSKKTYYVRICAYKKAGGQTYTGEWSAAKKAKVK